MPARSNSARTRLWLVSMDVENSRPPTAGLVTTAPMGPHGRESDLHPTGDEGQPHTSTRNAEPEVDGARHDTTHTYKSRIPLHLTQGRGRAICMHAPLWRDRGGGCFRSGHAMPEAQRPHAPPRERLRARAGTQPEGQNSCSGYEVGAPRAQHASAEAATRRRSSRAPLHRRATRQRGGVCRARPARQRRWARRAARG